MSRISCCGWIPLRTMVMVILYLSVEGHLADLSLWTGSGQPLAQLFCILLLDIAYTDLFILPSSRCVPVWSTFGLLTVLRKCILCCYRGLNLFGSLFRWKFPRFVLLIDPVSVRGGLFVFGGWWGDLLRWWRVKLWLLLWLFSGGMVLFV